MRDWVYMLASGRNGTLYVGVTNDLARRIREHRDGDGAAFTRKYGVARLVWAECSDDIEAAIAQEKRIKRWRRAWKLALVEKDSPDWRDLYDELNARPGAGRVSTGGKAGPRLSLRSAGVTGKG